MLASMVLLVHIEKFLQIGNLVLKLGHFQASWWAWALWMVTLCWIWQVVFIIFIYHQLLLQAAWLRFLLQLLDLILELNLSFWEPLKLLFETLIVLPQLIGLLLQQIHFFFVLHLALFEEGIVGVQFLLLLFAFPDQLFNKYGLYLLLIPQISQLQFITFISITIWPFSLWFFIFIWCLNLEFDANVSRGSVVRQSKVFATVFLFYQGLEIFNEEFVTLLQIVLFFWKTLFKAVLEILNEVCEVWFWF